jgi:hypothetical protein
VTALPCALAHRASAVISSHTVAVLAALLESVECRRVIAAAATTGAGATGAQGGHIDLKEQSCNDRDGLNELPSE